MQAHFLRYSCEIFTTKTCYVENKTIRLSIEKMRKMMLAMLRMRMSCCRISGGGTSNRLFTTGGFIIVPPSCTFISRPNIFLLFPTLALVLSLLLSPHIFLSLFSFSRHHFHFYLRFLTFYLFLPSLHFYFHYHIHLIFHNYKLF